MGLLPNLATSHPAIGSEVSSPAGNPSKTPPNAALLKCNFCWMFGIRDAQLEKHSPAKKKKKLTAIRAALLMGAFISMVEVKETTIEKTS
jgi:hypothetical protein